VSARIEHVAAAPRGIEGIVGAVRGRWLLVTAITVAFAVLFGIVVNRMTPIYRGATILAPADLDKKSMGSGLSGALGSVSGFAALAGVGLGSNDYATEEAMAVLKSQEFTQDYIKDKNLLPLLFPKAWDAATGSWKPGKKQPTLGAGFRAFENIRKVKRDKTSGLITLQVDWKDPVKAADMANELVDRLNDEMRQRALVQAEASIGYLQKEFTSTADVTSHEAISRLMEDEIKQEMLAHVTKQYSLQVVDRAVPADLDAPVRPIKLLYIAFGVFLGAGVGTLVAVKVSKRALSGKK
jgi:capsular polysaccharide biosynthesis protein